MRVATAPDRTTTREPPPWAAYVERDDGALAYVLRGFATEADARWAGLRAAALDTQHHKEG